MNNYHTTNLFKDYCYILEDYQQEIKHILDMDVLETKDVVVQAPVEINVSTEKKKTDEELAEQAAKRKEQGKDYRNRLKKNDWKN